MNLDEQILKRVDKQMLNQLVNENVIRFPNQNTLKTKIKQNQNPRNESFGGFFYCKISSVYFEYKSGDEVSVICTNWSKELDKVYKDHLSVSINSKEYSYWINNKAY